MLLQASLDDMAGIHALVVSNISRTAVRHDAAPFPPPDYCSARPLQIEDLKPCMTPPPGYRYRISEPRGWHQERADCTDDSGRTPRVDNSLSLLDMAASRRIEHDQGRRTSEPTRPPPSSRTSAGKDKMRHGSSPFRMAGNGRAARTNPETDSLSLARGAEMGGSAGQGMERLRQVLVLFSSVSGQVEVLESRSGQLENGIVQDLTEQDF
ncbi:hypothetical protein LZ30DRAFT_735724 [Colletotrichum cereale]|nr:hypothetical protein LZ30DRAFT_735724 [Colletotrichum cereale]